jgi:hypothetical protein
MKERCPQPRSDPLPLSSPLSPLCPSFPSPPNVKICTAGSHGKELLVSFRHSNPAPNFSRNVHPDILLALLHKTHTNRSNFPPSSRVWCGEIHLQTSGIQPLFILLPLFATRCRDQVLALARPKGVPHLGFSHHGRLQPAAISPGETIEESHPGGAVGVDFWFTPFRGP